MKKKISWEAYDINKQTIYIVPKSDLTTTTTVIVKLCLQHDSVAQAY